MVFDEDNKESEDGCQPHWQQPHSAHRSWHFNNDPVQENEFNIVRADTDKQIAGVTTRPPDST